jgi:outer membrane protein OmpA-like peptidoglycan-associated protein
MASFDRVPMAAALIVAVALTGMPCASDAQTNAAAAQTTRQTLSEAVPSGLDSAPSLPGRPDESSIAEPPRLAQLQRQIDALQGDAQANCVDAYQTHKAQAWLNFSKYAFHSGLPVGTQARTLAETGAIVEARERRGEVSLATNELPGSRHLRDDLWRGVDAVKHDGRMCSAPKLTAFCEVQLAWAGYEASVGGWRHVDPYVRIAEDYCTQASAAKVPPPPPPAAVKKDFELPPERTPVFERFELSASVLFPHDRSRRQDMRAEGRAQLKQLAEHIKSIELTSVTVVGHADITGTPVYNLALSKRRAETVAAELQTLGVDPTKFVTVGVGNTEPVVSCRASMRHKHRGRYLACLEPNRRVTIELAGTVAREEAVPQP